MIDREKLKEAEALLVVASEAFDRSEKLLDDAEAVYAAMGTSGIESPSYRGDELDLEREQRDRAHEDWKRQQGFDPERSRENSRDD